MTFAVDWALSSNYLSIYLLLLLLLLLRLLRLLRLLLIIILPGLLFQYVPQSAWWSSNRPSDQEQITELKVSASSCVAR